MRTTHLALFLSIGLCFSWLALHAESADWPQWRGVDRSGVSQETGLLKQWPEEGPELLWSVEAVGKGFSSPSIANGMLYITGILGKKEMLSAYDLDGNLKWQKTYGKAWKKSFPEARTTPTVDGDAVYVISGMGEVVCLDAASGDIRWYVDAFKKFEGKQGSWGTAESPLVVDDKVIYTPCGPQTTVVALDKRTGETVWASESLGDQSGYTSPIWIERGGKKFIVTVTGTYILGIDVQDGTIAWNVNYKQIPPPKGGKDINPVTPLYHEGRIYVTSGYDHVGVMLELSEDGANASVLWYDSTLDCHHGGVVRVDGYIYGANWLNNKNGNWVCLDWETGEVKYEEKWHTKGSIIAADGMLYCYEEKKGNVALVTASPEKFNVVSTFRITQGKGPHWAHPVISDGRLYIRHGDALMAYDIMGTAP